MRSLMPTCAIGSGAAYAALVSLWAALSMGADGCSDSTRSEPTCEHGGKTYSPGQRFPAADGCNTCSCSDTGDVECTLLGCEAQGESCEWRGETYAHATQVPSDDCNTCACFKGEVGCTNRACAPDYCEHQGKRYEVGESFDIGCSACGCGEGGVIHCTPNVCPEVVQCVLGDAYFDVGDSVICADGCNTCTCTAATGKPIFLETLIGCSPPPAIEVCPEPSATAVSVTPLYIAQDALAVELEFPGYCADHIFKLCTDGVFHEPESGRPELKLWVEDSSLDVCSDVTRQERVFDLSPLRALYTESHGSPAEGIELLLGEHQRLYAF